MDVTSYFTVTQKMIMTRQYIYFLRIISVALVIAFIRVLPAQAADPAYDQVIQGARNGNYPPALDYLQQMVAKNPNNLRARYDLLAINSWAGNSAIAVQQYQDLNRASLLKDPPVYVLDAAARAYRAQKGYPQALQLYRQAIVKSPNDWDLRSSEVLTLVDMGETQTALSRIETIRPNARGLTLDNLDLTTAYALEKANRMQEASDIYQKILARNPGNEEARRRFTALLTDNRQAPRAAAIASDDPKAFKPAELRRFEGNASAQLIRQGRQPLSELGRYGDTDLALEKLEAQQSKWSGNQAVTESYRRATYDRIVALRDRSRMKDVLLAYKDLRAQPNPESIPTFVEQAVGDAYLYLRYPEQAEKYYNVVLKADPDDLQTRENLFYAQMEQEHLPQAMATLKELQARAAKATPADQRNAALLTAKAKGYVDDWQGAQEKIEPMVKDNPKDIAANVALGDVYLARGWARQAEPRFQAAQQSDQAPVKSLSWQVGQAYNAMDLSDYPTMDRDVQRLRRVYPENLAVQRLTYGWDVYQRPELYVRVSPVHRDNAVGTGWNAFQNLVYLSSPTFYENRTRVYASFTDTHDKVREADGYWRRSALGIQQQWRDWRFNGAVTENDYYDDNHRVGGIAEANYMPDDHWTFGLRGEIMTADTPLRGLRNGVTGNSAVGSVAYTANELWGVKGRIGAVDFSDNNNREYYGVDGKYRWMNSPYIKGDLLSSASGSFNSKQDVSYFSPKADFGFNIGPKFEQLIYRRYDVKYTHAISILPGAYFQTDADAQFIASATYEQRFAPTQAFNTGWSATYARQSYDGRRENAVILMWDADWHF